MKNALSYEVILANQMCYSGILIGGDPITDIAILAIEETNLKVACFTKDSSTIQLGSTAFAIGNPLGTLGNTVTTGIISSTSRKIKTSDGTNHELIQTDAAINSGNSGGGLFNIAGELVGIVSSKYADAGIEGLGFAVPANIAYQIATQLCEKGYVEGHYKLGITISDGRYMNGGFFQESQKVTYISAIDNDGCCYGQLKKEDILSSIQVQYDNQDKAQLKIEEIQSANEVYDFLEQANLSIDDRLIFTILRNGKEMKVTVTLTQYVYQNSI